MDDLVRAMDVGVRMGRNYQDQNAPGPAAELTNVGTRSSGQDAVHPIVVAEGTGLTSSATLKQVHQRPGREEEIASAVIAKEGERRMTREAGLPI